MQSTAPFMGNQRSTSMASSSPYARVMSLLFPLLVIAVIIIGLAVLPSLAKYGLKLGYPRPVVNITSLPNGGRLLINRSEQFTSNARGRDLTYIWDFGDQSASVTTKQPTAVHAYQSNGNFNVTVTVHDALGQQGTDTASVQVYPPPPTATFTYSTYSGYYGYAGYVTFDASGSAADPSTSLANYQWDFGDGTTDTTYYPQESHQYVNSGTYTVTLVVTDATNQASTQYTQSVTV